VFFHSSYNFHQAWKHVSQSPFTTYCNIWNICQTRKSHLQTITRQMTISSHLSMRDARMVVAIAEGWTSFNLKTLSITDSSVDVVSMPQKEHQSFTTIPAAITSEPRLTVPACNTLTLCVASYPWHRYIKHQFKPFTHQCHILWHMHCNYINILPILININFKILQLTFNSVNIGTHTHTQHCQIHKNKYSKLFNTLLSKCAHVHTHTQFPYYYT